MGLQAVVGLLLLGGACANQYDVLYPNYLPPVECAHGCAKWSDVQSDGLPFNQSLVDKLFANGTVPKEAGSSCLWPGMAPVHGEGRRMLTADEGWLWEAATPRPGASSIPYCLCKPAPGQNSTLKPPVTPAGQCLPPMSVPEQINLQYASNEITVAGFVTYEAVLPADPPIAMFAEKGATMRSLTGISHWYNSSKFGAMRNYTMSFVKFAGLKPSTVYQYKVKSGADGAAWSEVFEFRSLREAPDTKFGIYGDMGISPYNNMQNLLTDCQSGKIDVFVHMGDHCYDLQMEDDRKGDAYMNSMQPLTATCPWVPIIGNHEGSDIGRYDSQTWGEVYGNPLNGSTSTATSALGHVLSKGTMLGAGMHGTTPSGSSNFFSVDIGLVHIAVLSTISPNAAELAWLEKDLSAANANRDKVPWVWVSSHYQIYLSSSFSQEEKDRSSAAFYHGEGGEYSPDPRDAFKTCSAAGEAEGCATVGDFLREAAGTLDPVFQKYGVDVYDAGHAHEYGVTWPMAMGTAAQKNYTNPLGTVYITEGNGGVPGVTSLHKFNKPGADWARIHGTGGAYGRIALANKSTLVYEHVWNNGNNGTGEVMETWALERTSTYVHPSSWPTPPSSYNCASPTDGQCTKVSGTGGAYPDEASCVAAAVCAGSWNCDSPADGKCTHVADATGKFKSLASCEKDKSCQVPPGPPPGPPPAGMAWECHRGKILSLSAGGGLTDHDLTKPPFGLPSATVVTCEEACIGYSGCVTVNWHEAGQGEHHCHVLTGTVSHPDFLKKLSTNKDYSACMLVKAQ